MVLPQCVLQLSSVTLRSLVVLIVPRQYASLSQDKAPGRGAKVSKAPQEVLGDGRLPAFTENEYLRVQPAPIIGPAKVYLLGRGARRTREAKAMKRRAIAVLLAVAGLGLAGACAGPRLRAGEARITAEHGEVLVAEPGQALRPAEGRILPAGSRFKAVSGSATIALAAGLTLEARQGSELALTSPPTLVAGDLLVVRAVKPLRVQAAGSQLLVEGAARLSRDLAVTAASYGGQVTVESAGRSVRVDALRQASIASLGMVPAKPQALRYGTATPGTGGSSGPPWT